MWTNLLTGTLGAILGAAGVFAAAVITIRWTSRNDADLARQARNHVAQQARHADSIRVSGQLADRLVEFYDNLRDATAQSPSGEQSIELKDLRLSAVALRRAITVDGPLLPRDLEQEMQDNS